MAKIKENFNRQNQKTHILSNKVYVTFHVKREVL